MKRVMAVLAVLSIAGPGALCLGGQFRAEEIARRPEMESFLSTAEIVGFRAAGEGVTKPFILTLRKDGQTSRAVWKNPHGIQDGFLEGWQYEIAAYRLDKLIGLHMIPAAVEREFQGKPGALILWAENKFSLLKVSESHIVIPDDAQDRVNKAKWLTRAWDSLIANEDRTQQNVLYTEDWRTVLIDHSRAFRSSKAFTERLMFGADGIKRFENGSPILFRRLPRKFVESLKGLTHDALKAATGDLLTEPEIRALLTRRDLLVKQVEGMIKNLGEGNVLYQ